MELQLVFDALRLSIVILASMGAIWSAIDYVRFGAKIEKNIILFCFLILLAELTAEAIVK